MSSSNRVHGLRKCSQEGSRKASRFAIQVEVTAARREAECLQTSRGRADEIAGVAAARKEEDQCHTFTAGDIERLDAIDNMGDFTHNWRDIRPRALIVLVGLFCHGMLPTEFSFVHILYD